LLEAETRIIEREITSKNKKYLTYMIYIPKDIWSDSAFQPFLEKKKIKIKTITKDQEIKIKGPALLITPTKT